MPSKSFRISRILNARKGAFLARDIVRLAVLAQLMPSLATLAVQDRPALLMFERRATGVTIVSEAASKQAPAGSATIRGQSGANHTGEYAE